MRYSISRTISPKRFFPEMNFESANFTIEDCDSKEQAIKEVNQFIMEWLEDTKSRRIKDPLEKFKADLDKTGDDFDKAIKKGKGGKCLNKETL